MVGSKAYVLRARSDFISHDLAGLYFTSIYTSRQETRYHRIKICTFMQWMILLDSFVLKGAYKGEKKLQSPAFMTAWIIWNFVCT